MLPYAIKSRTMSMHTDDLLPLQVPHPRLTFPLLQFELTVQESANRGKRLAFDACVFLINRNSLSSSQTSDPAGEYYSLARKGTESVQLSFPVHGSLVLGISSSNRSRISAVPLPVGVLVEITLSYLTKSAFNPAGIAGYRAISPDIRLESSFLYTRAVGYLDCPIRKKASGKKLKALSYLTPDVGTEPTALIASSSLEQFPSSSPLGRVFTIHRSPSHVVSGSTKKLALDLRGTLLHASNPLSSERGEQEHLYAAFLPDVGLPGSENTAMMISIIASFFSFFQNLGANAIATGASPVTSVSESFSGSITRIGAKDACNRKLSQRASIQINS
ncbi:hypothetical protein V6N12_076048 [Hibiscus sabdariffa]|uniref:Uncharacterized protein n=1 Tax=Hibiscus sabdariffa TaxID=183260 RepID=A0ABR2AZI7_9ROSI